jgi:hypothetical protein
MTKFSWKFTQFVLMTGCVRIINEEFMVEDKLSTSLASLTVQKL